MVSDALESIFQALFKKPSDTNEHLPTLRKYASRCKTVAEIGSWKGVSSTALAAGLEESSAVDKILTLIEINYQYLVGVDLMLRPHLDSVDLKILSEDSLKVELPEVDMLFIDSLHTYEHLSKELEKHGNKAKKFLAFHDTVTYGLVGEDRQTPGLLAAIDEFRDKNKFWKIEEKFDNNNGLLILSR